MSRRHTEHATFFFQSIFTENILYYYKYDNFKFDYKIVFKKLHGLFIVYSVYRDI